MQVLLLHPDTRILHGNAQTAPPSVIVNSDCYRALEGELDCVANEVKENLFEAFGVAVYFIRHMLGYLEVQLEIFLINLEGHYFADLVNSFP